MAPCILFKDIGKTANDILNDDYNFNRTLKVKTKTANGVTFTTEGSMGQNKAILAKLSSSFLHSSGLNVSKLQVTTHGRLTGELSLTNALVDGLKLTFKAEDGALKNPAGIKYKPMGKLGAEYRLDQLSATTEADFANNVVGGSAVFAYQNFHFGGNTSVSIEKSSFIGHNLAASYCGPDFHATLATKKQFNVISASFDHMACRNVVYAAVLDYDLKSQANALTVGGRYKPDPETVLCGKASADGLLSLACVQKLRPMVSMTASALVDLKNIEGESHKFGLGITLG